MALVETIIFPTFLQLLLDHFSAEPPWRGAPRRFRHCRCFPKKILAMLPDILFLQEDLCLDSCDIPDISPSDGSWIGALMPAGAVFSGVVAGWLLGRVGRRWTMVICAAPFLVGSVLYVVAYQVENEIPIYFGRVLTGERRRMWEG